MASKEKIAPILEKYKKVQRTYKEFSITVKFILETLLKNNGYHYQVVSAREKDPGSLEQKLRDNSKLQNIPLSELDDLAGCRVIFYLDSDIQRFIEYVYKEFSVIKNVPKFSPDDYNAHHLVVHLNKDRLNLTEYSKFASLKCEIQLTTVLYHAWSEMAHDIIYKPQKELPKFDRHAFESLKKQFSDVMQNHIRQASYSFEFIYKQFEKLKQGKTVFDAQFLEGIMKSASNNDLYEQLSLLRQFVQEFGDKTPKNVDIITIIDGALIKAKDNALVPIKTALGEFEGKHYADIAEVCLDILSELKYFYIENIFELLVHLSSDSKSTVKKKAIEILSELASYNMYVLQKIGYSPQLFVLDQISKWDNAKINEQFEAVMEIASQLLKPAFEGTSMSDYKTFTLHYGPLIVNDDLKDVRSRTMNLLKRLYHDLKEITQRIRILQVLQDGSQTPHQGNYGDDLLQMIVENTNLLIEFYDEILPTAENEIIKDIEEQSQFFARRGLNDKVDSLLSNISSNKEYGIYRILIGYDYRLAELDVEETEKLRKEKLQELVDSITPLSFDDWQRRILSIIKNYQISWGEFQYFNVFLFEIGKQKTEFALMLLDQNEKELEPFLIHLLGGLWKGESSRNAVEVLKKWINENKRLSVCASLFEYVEEIDITLLKRIYGLTCKNNNADVLSRIISAIDRNYAKHPKRTNLKKIFVGAVRKQAELKNYQWIRGIWSRESSLLDTLSVKDYESVLDSLIFAPDIDYHAERILSPLAEKHPKELIQFFKERVSKRQKKQEGERYDAIPFSLHIINKPLQKRANVVVRAIVGWFSEKDWLFQWEASHFLQAIFPTSDKALESEMINLVKKGWDKNAKIVISVLRAYKGEPFLHGVCKEFIKRYHSERYIKEMFIILSQTGVVSGEYGFVEAYKAKRHEIQDWKKDKNKTIRLFVKKYEAYLDRRIAYEHKRTDEDIEMRKREFT
ncbi:MAG: RelA/SpoT domain-containing protein [Nitrospirae bacterium]|nr:RelA/SpoT domain-containing protein [Nitrospirota bacterium]